MKVPDIQLLKRNEKESQEQGAAQPKKSLNIDLNVN